MQDPTDRLDLYEADAVVLQAVTAELRRQAARWRRSAMDSAGMRGAMLWEHVADELEERAVDLETRAAAFWRGYAFAEAAR